MVSLLDPLGFDHGPAMRNRFMLAPLTNQQSHVDGTLSDAEHKWLTMRAQGGFGLTMTCAAHVQRIGQGFSGQLGCFDDIHVAGLSRLAADITSSESVAVVQLHHAGNRSPRDLIGEQPVCPSDDPQTGARALTNEEVHGVIADFVAAAARADDAGFDGVELHGAHGYLICQFLSPEVNQRSDEFGGTAENRARLLFEIVKGIRATCRSDFNVSVRLSPERFGLVTGEMIDVYERLIDMAQVDFIDMSLWDVFKCASDDAYSSHRLIDLFAEIPRRSVRLAVAGKIYSARAAQDAIDAGADMAVIGRAAIVHHDFPRKVENSRDFEMRSLPVSSDDLRNEGLSESFIGYMKNWPGFVADDADS